MVARKFIVRHAGEEFTIDYDTSDGLDVFKFQIFSLTDVPPDDQNILVEDGDIFITESSDLASVSEKLRLVSIHEKGEVSGTGGGDNAKLKSSGMSDEELARMLQAEEDLIAFQMHQAANTDGTREFEQKIRPMVSQILMYEDPVRQEAARKTVPFDRIEEKALVSLAKEGNFNPSKAEKDHAFLLQLLFWFKGSFRWVDSPPCDNCGSETTSCGMGNPVASERQFGASRVEMYRCNNCSRTTRFPRYNDPLMLLETRKGRCGEWANCFTLYCRAFGYDSRLILDFTDHLWTECFSEFHGRWMHLDPCEGVYDNPLLYEKGWNKKLSYVIAISRDGVRDVTKRYTRKWHEVLPRRGMISEIAASAILSNITSECRKGYTSQTIHNLELRDQEEAHELGSLYLVDDSSLSLPGRQSGSEEWRMARYEVGVGENNHWSYSYCPVRICYDNHVHDIHSSLTRLLSHFVEDNFSKPEVIKNLEILRRLLVDLKSRPFKVRRTSLNINSTDSKLFKEASPSLDEFFSSLSLKREYGCISLSGNPVLTSIALPVALHTLDEIIRGIGTVDHFDRTLVNNYSRLNRISSGSVQASGEHLPSGIATAAFDGCRLSKWEEPNGAKGCWLIYKVKDGHLCLLDSYDLMSANDAPERDPMDWVLDGSEDGGLHWQILDQRSSQTFENRFQRKRFRVLSSRKSNAFRFRVLKVRDPDTQPKFQIGSIDLYANVISPSLIQIHNQDFR